MRARLLTILTLLPLALAAGCGAPVKSAGEVSSLFNSTSVTLQDKVGTICRELQARTEAPTTNNLGINVNGCGDAGLAALNYKEITAFKFLGLEGEVPPKDKAKVIEKAVRGQLWLNKDLLGFATALASKFKNAKNQAGAIQADDSGKQLENIIKINVDQKEPFKFDAAKMELGARIGITATGIVELNNELVIAGKLINDAFAITIKAASEQVVEKSLIKNISGLVLVVPHAGDVYIDMFLDVQVHNLGLASIFREQLQGIMSDGLKKIADTALAL